MAGHLQIGHCELLENKSVKKDVHRTVCPSTVRYFIHKLIQQFTCVSFNWSIRFSVHHSIGLFIYRFISILVHSFIVSSIYWSICLSVHPSIGLFVDLFIRSFLNPLIYVVACRDVWMSGADSLKFIEWVSPIPTTIAVFQY